MKDSTPIIRTVDRSGGGTLEEFGRVIRSEIVKWSKIAKDVGAKAE